MIEHEPTVDVEPRCSECKRMLARLLTRPWRLDCPRCGERNERLLHELSHEELDRIAPLVHSPHR